MGKVLIAILSLAVGLVVGALVGPVVGLGGGAGVGAATGVAAGACGAVRAAEEEGLLTPNEATRTLDRALLNLAALNPELEGNVLPTDEQDCQRALQTLREALSG